jgi:hypothetical protein
MSAIEIQEHLNQLKEERALALTEGLGENST